MKIYLQVSIPQIYTQVCTLSVYSFFAACLVSRQYTGDNITIIQEVDIYFPFWTILELIFYVGLLKVAQQMKYCFNFKFKIIITINSRL